MRTLRHCEPLPYSVHAVCPELNQSQSAISTFTRCPWPNLWPQKPGPGNPHFTGANTFVPVIRGGYHLALHEDRIVVTHGRTETATAIRDSIFNSFLVLWILFKIFSGLVMF